MLDAFFESCKADHLFGAKISHIDHVAQSALTWGMPPLVDVHAGKLKVPELGKIVDACGFTDTLPGHDSFIIITDIWFQAYETCGEEDRAKNAMKLTRILLHEMVHWVRDAVGADGGITVGGFRGTHQEAGGFFETKAYGTPSICTDASIKEAKASMRPNI